MLTTAPPPVSPLRSCSWLWRRAGGVDFSRRPPRGRQARQMAAQRRTADSVARPCAHAPHAAPSSITTSTFTYCVVSRLLQVFVVAPSRSSFTSRVQFPSRPRQPRTGTHRPPPPQSLVVPHSCDLHNIMRKGFARTRCTVYAHALVMTSIVRNDSGGKINSFSVDVFQSHYTALCVSTLGFHVGDVGGGSGTRSVRLCCMCAPGRRPKAAQATTSFRHPVQDRIIREINNLKRNPCANRCIIIFSTTLFEIQMITRA